MYSSFAATVTTGSEAASQAVTVAKGATVSSGVIWLKQLLVNLVASWSMAYTGCIRFHQPTGGKPDG